MEQLYMMTTMTTMTTMIMKTKIIMKKKCYRMSIIQILLQKQNNLEYQELEIGDILEWLMTILGVYMVYHFTVSMRTNMAIMMNMKVRSTKMMIMRSMVMNTKVKGFSQQPIKQVIRSLVYIT